LHWRLPAVNLLLLSVLVSGCAAFDPVGNARSLATEAGWRETHLDGSRFILVAFHSPAVDRAETIHVYIEGDGRAWRSRLVPSSDPTPRDPIGLRLALADPAPAVLYLGRACQYVRGEERKNCDDAYWTESRFAPEVIAATDEAVTRFLAAHPTGRPRRLVLFGYSGGGDVAALLAVRRSDVAALVTVASPLDHAAWTRQHDISPLSGSLNPAQAPALGQVPQVHFLGSRDDIVPPADVRPLIDRLASAGAAARAVEMPGYDHDCCWVANWKTLLAGLGLP
jgi:pimeloyl-ACP methyl ester carboxylesterase